MFIFPLLDYFLVDEIPLRHGPTIFPDIFTEFRDGVVFAGMISSGRSVVFLKYRLLALRRRQPRSEAWWWEPSPTSHEPSTASREPHEASHLHLELRLHVEWRRWREVTDLNITHEVSCVLIFSLN